MRWQAIRTQYPEQWLLVEAIRAHSEDQKRILDDLAVLDVFADSVAAMHQYTRLHGEAPDRELYVLHTSHEILDIFERVWFGIRTVR